MVAAEGCVVPFVGTWIEIHPPVATKYTTKASFPSWERGLKCPAGFALNTTGTVVPFVGTWIEIADMSAREIKRLVVPFVGTWIEIPGLHPTQTHNNVVPFVGTWIEIV